MNDPQATQAPIGSETISDMLDADESPSCRVADGEEPAGSISSEPNDSRSACESYRKRVDTGV